MTDLVITDACYWLATDRAKVAHFGYAGAGRCISTAQPEILTFPTMAALVAVLVECNFPVVSGSTRPRSEWYLWATKVQADAALAAINGNPAFPVHIPDPATDEPTVAVASWCSAPREMQDGRWGFPRISADILDAWNISVASREAWLAAFAPAIVVDPVFATP